MTDFLTMFAMGTGIYLLRLAGLSMPLTEIPPFWVRALRFLPVALLAALVSSSRAGIASGEIGRIVALIVAGLVVWKSRRMWAAIASGLAVFVFLNIVA